MENKIPIVYILPKDEFRKHYSKLLCGYVFYQELETHYRVKQASPNRKVRELLNTFERERNDES